MSNPLHPDVGGTRSTSWRMAAVVVGIILALGLGLLLKGCGSRQQSAAEVPPAAQSPLPSSDAAPGASRSAEAPATDPEASVCGLPGKQLTGALASAPQASWTLLGSTAVPRSPQAGPGIVQADGFRRCYARTPQGAVLAATNFIGIGAVRQLDAKTVEYLIAPGPGRDVLKAQLVASPAPDAGATSSSDGGAVQVAGFRLISYDGTNALVQVAMSIPVDGQTRYGQVPIPFRWSNGDWRYVPADNGQMAVDPQPVENLQGFIPFRGL